MKKHKLPANPKYFNMWYEFFADSNEKLNQALQPLINSNATLSEAANERIFDLVFGSADDAGELNAQNSKLASVVDGVMRVLATAGGETQVFGETLSTSTAKLEAADKRDMFEQIVITLVAETKTMQSKFAELQAQVDVSSGQVERLKGEIAEARQDASADALTGLANRKCFDAKLANAIMEAFERGDPLALIMLDLDHLDAINDKYGHAVGDRALSAVGRLLMNFTKGDDVAACYGRQQFAVILPQTTMEGAAALAQNLRHEALSMTIGSGEPGAERKPLTLSLGVSAYIAGESAYAFLDRADRALYTAKRSNRNRLAKGGGGPSTPDSADRPSGAGRTK